METLLFFFIVAARVLLSPLVKFDWMTYLCILAKVGKVSVQFLP